jgi:hypothetical protein
MLMRFLLVGCAFGLTVVACVGYDDVLNIKVLTPPKDGCRKAKDGDMLKMHYEGRLENGQSKSWLFTDRRDLAPAPNWRVVPFLTWSSLATLVCG